MLKQTAITFLLASFLSVGGFLLHEGVNTYLLTPKTKVALETTIRVYHEFNRLPIVVSTTDGKHMDGSLHYEGKAFDMRLSPKHGYSWKEIEAITTMTKRRLGKDFDVLFERNPYHLHVEYDPKK